MSIFSPGQIFSIKYLQFRVSHKILATMPYIVFTVSTVYITFHKILTLTKLKGLADDKIKVTQKLKFVLGRVENIVGKGENAGYQLFLHFPQCFQKVSSKGSLRVAIVC